MKKTELQLMLGFVSLATFLSPFQKYLGDDSARNFFHILDLQIKVNFLHKQ